MQSDSSLIWQEINSRTILKNDALENLFFLFYIVMFLPHFEMEDLKSYLTKTTDADKSALYMIWRIFHFWQEQT